MAVYDASLFSDEYDANFRVLGDVCGVSERAEEVIAFIDACLEDLSSRTGRPSRRKQAHCLGAGATFKGSHSIDGVYTNYPSLRRCTPTT